MSKELQKIQQNTLQFIHITDTHLLDHSSETFHNINTTQSLEKILNQCQARYADADFLLITGDVSQTGTKESYSQLKSLIQKFQMPVYCVPGNHDTPKLLQEVIPSCPDNSINIIQLGKYSLVLISSWVENKNHGVVSQLCLQELKDHLKNSKDQFNIIAIHHPPVFIGSRWLDEIGLQNKTEFLQILDSYSQNSLLLCGHIHQNIDQQINKLRVLSTPSTCHQYKSNTDHMQVMDMPPPAYRYSKFTSFNQIETKIHYVE